MGNFGFDTRAAAERVAEATRFVERTSRGGGPGGRRWPVGTEGGTTGARTPAGGIPPKSGNAPGSAVCTFYDWNGTTDILGSRTDTVRNRYSTAVAGNRDIEVYWDQGTWWFSVQSCT